MGDDDSQYTKLPREPNQREDFMTSKRSGGQDHIVLGNQLKALACVFGDLSVRIEHAYRRSSNSGGGHLALNLRPEGKLLTWTIDSAGGFVSCIYRRHPNDFVS